MLLIFKISFIIFKSGNWYKNALEREYSTMYFKLTKEREREREREREKERIRRYMVNK